MDVLLLIGLGNPGRKYRETRHNLGFRVLDRLAEVHGFKIGKKRFKAKYAIVELFGKKICCIEPQDFMNLSGEVVDSFWNYYKVKGEDVLVVHDDIDLPVGKLRLSLGAGHGGHNGIRSIHEWVYTKNFYRLRLGVGRPPSHMDPADYVLGKFDDAELPVVEDVVRGAVELVEVFYTKGPEIALTDKGVKY